MQRRRRHSKKKSKLVKWKDATMKNDKVEIDKWAMVKLNLSESTPTK